MSILAITIFFIAGFLEMLTWSLQTKALIKDRMVNTFIFTSFAVLIWYYVVDRIAQNISSVYLMVAYVIGCSFGNCVTIKLDKYIDKIARIRLWKKKRRVKRTLKKK